MADALITVAALSVTAGVRQNALRWTVTLASCLPYLGLAVVEVYAASSNDRSVATKIAETTDLNFVHTGLLIGVARYYWVRARDASGQFSDYFPLSPTSGVAGTPVSTGTGSVGSDELQDNSVGNQHLKVGAVTADRINVTELAAISATLGNVSVNGNLLVNGTITAAKYADLSIGTDKVADNNITNMGSVMSNGNVNVDIVSSPIETELQRLVYTPSNSNGKLAVKGCVYARTNGDQVDATVRLKRSGTTVQSVTGRIDDIPVMTFPVNYIDDSPGTSQRTWTITFDYTYPGSTGAIARWHHRYLEVVEYKK